MLPIKQGLCFKGQLENIAFVGRILDVYRDKLVVLDLIQLSPSKVNHDSVVWPYKAVASLGPVQVITEEQYRCTRDVLV